MLRVDDVHKSYQTPLGPLKVLTGVSMSVAAGETLALTGESGSGKSTLLHLIGGLDGVDQGAILVDGHKISSQSEAERAAMRRTQIGLIFQQFNLIPSLTVTDNIAFQARLAGRRDEAWEKTLVVRLGLDGLETRYPEQLSGGQQQRVAIARTLAARPPLILADEPTGNLDEATGDAVLTLTLELARDTQAAFLMVTHSLRLADRLDRRVHLTGGQIAS
ncbi:MAG: ABC transporter ATP-binding protein [Pseudomonadota bacterium]